MRRGFTITEVLVVAAITGLLSTIVLLNANSTRADARDVERYSEIVQLEVLVQQYRVRNGTLPSALSDLVPDFLPAVPVDPNGTTTYAYIQTGGNFKIISDQVETETVSRTDDRHVCPTGCTGCASSDDTAYSVYTVGGRCF